jgi:hypothetical protein
MREMLPFYDAPEERVQNSSRVLAELLRTLASDEQALIGLESLARAGMTPLESSFGSTRALWAADGLEEVLTHVLPALTERPELRPAFDTLLSGLGLELATPLTAEERADALDQKALLHTPVAVSAPKPLLVSTRDARGLPEPVSNADGSLPFPFVDANADGLADEDRGWFRSNLPDGRELPSPFARLFEGNVARDAHGQAYGFEADGSADHTRSLFNVRDVAPTVLGVGAARLAPLFDPRYLVFEHLMHMSPALFGPRISLTKAYDKGKLAFVGPSAAQSPFVDLTYAVNTLVDLPAYGDSLALARHLLVEHEAELTRALTPWLALEKNTRNEQDLYPEAQLSVKNTFWDELLYQVERLSRRRRGKDGETTAEALMRAGLGYARDLSVPEHPIARVMSTDVLRHEGALLATLMRFKDEWRPNPKGESKRAPGEDAVRGAFRTPVDRTLGDVPVTCGKDGCGGLLAGSPFEDWLRKSPQQKCLLGNEGRSGADCGSASNQSLFQRSLGLIWEMAGRAQKNKRITVGDLLDFAVLEDPCDNLNPQVACMGANTSAKNAFCEEQFGSTDFACDELRGVCIAERTSATCQAYRKAQQDDRAQSIALAEDAVAQDYTCPASEPNASCHAYESLYPAAFVVTEGAEAAIQPGHLLDMPDVGRAFGRALIHDFVIDVPNPWVRRYLEDVARAANATLPTCDPGDIDDPAQIPHRNSDDAECVPNAAKLSRDVYQDMPASVDTLGELVEFLLDDSTLFTNDEDTALLRPEAEALSRVLFAPPGSSSFIVFDPLLVSHAPPSCADMPALKACAFNQGTLDAQEGCCIADMAAPPLRYRLDTYYGSTTFSWEHPFAFSDGTTLSFIGSMRTLADAIDRTDFHAEAGDDPADFESTDYAFTTLGKLFAEHYDSERNPLAQTKNASGMHYRRLTNVVSYEPLLADALDDGTITDALVNAQAFRDSHQHLSFVYSALPMLEAVSKLTFEGGRDGIDVASDLLELSLSAHARCAGASGDRRVLASKGACDHAEAHEPGFAAPLTYRDGRATICWENGQCFADKNDRRFVSPTYVLLDAVGSVDDAIGDDADVRRHARAAVGGVLDAYLTFDDEGFRDRSLHALLASLLDYTTHTWRDDQTNGRLKTLRSERTDDAATFVQGPVFAGGLAALEGLARVEHTLDKLSAYAFAMLSQEDTRRALTGGLADALESRPGNAQDDALYHVAAKAIVPALDEVLAGKASASIDEGYLFRSLTLLRDTATRDDEQVLTRVFANLSSLRTKSGASPLDVLWSVLTRVERAEPGKSTLVNRADFKQMLTHMADVLTDHEHGFERLYDMLRCRNAGPGCE